MVEPEPVEPVDPGRELEEPVGRLVSESMLVPALPVPLAPLVPLVPLEPLMPPDPLVPLVSELPDVPEP